MVRPRAEHQTIQLADGPQVIRQRHLISSWLRMEQAMLHPNGTVLYLAPIDHGARFYSIHPDGPTVHYRTDPRADIPR